MADLDSVDSETTADTVVAAVDSDADCSAEFSVEWPADGCMTSLATGRKAADMRRRRTSQQDLEGRRLEMTPVRDLAADRAEISAAEEMRAFEERMCFIGHSHYPGVFEQDGAGAIRYTRAAVVRLVPGHRYLVNVPSVGQPRDSDARAGYQMVDEEEGLLRQVRLGYDIAGAMRRIREAGLPHFLSERLQWGE